MKETLFVSFSGGRTSAYMCWYLLKYWGHKYHFIFIYSNTGLEAEGTLEFVDQCDREMGLNLIWVEAKVNPVSGAEIEFNQVCFKSASRRGEPFEAMCAKHGVPNADRSFCTQYLKTYPINAYKHSLGYARGHKTAIGIRADEFDRMKIKELEEGKVTYPLISKKHTTKPDVLMFFKDYDFDLEIDEIDGNCVGCFKKSDRHLMTIAKHRPWVFDFFREMVKKYGHIKDANGGRAKDGDPYHFFRGNKTADNIIAMSQEPFVEFAPTITEFQLSFDIDPLDEVGDCGGACEAF